MLNRCIGNYISSMLRDKISDHIRELKSRYNLTAKEFAVIIRSGEKTAQNRFNNNNWTFEEIEAIEKHFGERILYPAKDYFANDEIKAIVQIELKKKQKEKVLELLIGKKDLEILNK